jgi:hypothetical protein
MADEYDKEDCKDRHKELWEEIKSLRTQINWFYLLAVATLAASVGNLIGGGK